MSWLRAKCPDCRTLTAVWVGDGYQCHACGREFAAGLVRVPRAHGRGGGPMIEAAGLALPYPEAAVIEHDVLEEQIVAQAAASPPRPLVLGGCCCAHVGAIQALAVRPGRLAVVWLDAHGDLNTPESSPSGNAWGMPLRMAIERELVRPQDVALVGARSLDPPEQAYLAETGIDDDVSRALAGCDRAYVALDCDVLRPGELACFMPEPGGPTVDELERLLAEVATRVPVAGLGLTGLAPEADVATLVRLAKASGL
jgi:arginase